MVLAEARKRSEVWINNPVHSDHECQCGSQYGPKVATDTQQQDMSNYGSGHLNQQTCFINIYSYII